MTRSVALSTALLAGIAALGCGESQGSNAGQAEGGNAIAEAGPVMVTVYKSPT